MRRKKPAPRPQQRKGLAALKKAFRSSDRATIVMACGTGKTYVGLWAAQQQRAKTVLVLVPSLGLIQQTLAEWKAASKVPFKWLCCCSDRGVEDALVDVQFEPTNERDAIDAFMRSGGIRVVFSTYQSAAVLRGMKFDLVIVDEAHKTVGERQKPFAFALNDRNIRAKKRLFMTATPRVLEEKPNRTKSPNSMDIEKTYGDIVYRLPFSQAVKEKIIVDYKILVCEVRPEEIDADVDLAKVDLEHAVGLIAVKKAMKKYKIRKVITFNSSIDAARRFADAAKGYVAASVHHVNGKMPILERTNTLKSFKAHERSLITNARCLTEGIDVPTVDMVTFLAPKRSVVDVTQAAGRVMRRSPGKRCGYILLPVLVDSKASDEHAVASAMRRGRFDRTFEILLALQDNDDVLAATMNRARQELGETDDDELSDKTRAAIAERVEFIGDGIHEKTFEVAMVRRISSNNHEMFGKLKRFIEKTGRLPIKRESNLTNTEGRLYSWYVHMFRSFDRGINQGIKSSMMAIPMLRALFRHGGLKRDFEFFSNLEAIERHVANNSTIPPRLLEWYRRFSKRNSRTMTRDKSTKERFEAVGLAIHLKDNNVVWQQKFSKVRAFYRKHRRGPSRSEDQRLDEHITRVRLMYKKGRLSPERIEQFEELTRFGFHWSESHRLEALVDELEHFVSTTGRWPSVGTKMGSFASELRRRDSRGTIAPSIRTRLDSFGFDWAPHYSKVMNVIRSVQIFIEKNQRLPASGEKLHNLVTDYAKRYRKKHTNRFRDNGQLRDIMYCVLCTDLVPRNGKKPRNTKRGNHDHLHA